VLLNEIAAIRGAFFRASLAKHKERPRRGPKRAATKSTGTCRAQAKANDVCRLPQSHQSGAEEAAGGTEGDGGSNGFLMAVASRSSFRGATMKSSAVFRRAIRVAAVTAIGIGVIAGVAYVEQRPSCETDPRGIVGEVKWAPDGRFQYFDGHCWSAKPMPPTDIPF